MSPKTLVITALLALLPISELRGAIPYALGSGVSPALAFPLCVFLNMLVAPIVYLFLSTVNRLLLKIRAWDRFFNRVIERARSKVQSKVEKYGYLGLALFVAIPLPITGAYTGTLGAWILGMDPRKTIAAVALGVLIAGIVVTVVTLLGISALSIFIKPVNV